MNDFRNQVNAAYHAPGGSLWRAAAAEVRNIVETASKR